MPVLKKLLLSLIFALCANMASAMFIQPDWLDPTEPGVGTNRYAYSGNDPINKLDPGGNESIIVSGGVGEEHGYGEHFLENGFDRAEDQKEEDPNTTWVIHKGVGRQAYSDDVMAKYRAKATKAGIKSVVASSTAEIENYLNNKSTAQGASNEARLSDTIDYFAYVGHGLRSGLAPEYFEDSSGTARIGTLFNPGNLNSRAFSSGAAVNLNATCNSAGPGRSAALGFTKVVSPGSRISGTYGTVNFGTPGVDTDHQLLGNPYTWGLPIEKLRRTFEIRGRAQYNWRNGY